MVAGAPRVRRARRGARRAARRARAGRAQRALRLRLPAPRVRARRACAIRARTLCTVKLSRRLYPEHARHNLDSLIERHGLECRARHRAMGDAEAVWQFLRVAPAERGEEVLAVAARQVAKQPTLPAHIDRAMVDAIPDAPGVYLFYGEGAAPLYVGKSIAMRTRVLQHFGDDVRSSKEMQLAREVRRIEWQRTAGELGALLREAALVKELLPVFNRQLRRPARAVRLRPGREAPAPGAGLRRARASRTCTACSAPGAPRWRRCAASRTSTACACRPWASRPRARARASATRSGAAPALCAGKETFQAHHARLAAALGALKTLAWPWRGPVGVRRGGPGARNDRAARRAPVVLPRHREIGGRSAGAARRRAPAALRPRPVQDPRQAPHREAHARVELPCTSS